MMIYSSSFQENLMQFIVPFSKLVAYRYRIALYYTFGLGQSNSLQIFRGHLNERRMNMYVEVRVIYHA